MTYDINHLRETQIEALDYIVEICEENKLSYWLHGGTLLGAIRHNGYIPWDDDLDIAMLRKDYDKFLKYVKENPSNDFFIQNYETEKNSSVIFTKVRKNNTSCIEKNSQFVDSHKGIFVDVFPMDFIDENNSLKYRVLAFMLRLLDSTRTGKIHKRKIRDLKDCLMFPVRLLPISVVNRLITKLLKIVGKTKQDYAASYFGSGIVKDKIRIDNVIPVKYHIFEGKNYAIPNNTDVVLKVKFGSDYMQLPKEEDRITHGFLSVTWND